jgi:predicted dehydrogenase
MPSQPFSRRDVLKTATGAAAALSLARSGAAQSPAPPPPPGPGMIGVPFERRERVRFALVGCGGRGMGLLHDILGIEGVEVKAVCDIVPEKVARAQAAVTKAGQKSPDGYAKGERHFEELCRRGDLDLVYVATPWSWHVPMAVAGMEGGAHVGVEVPAAVTLEECWRLVDASERTRRHCVILENCCYGWSEMLVLNLVRAGMLGELTHAECAYIHDLRALLFEDRGEGLWRRYEHFRRNGNLYPTHGLGPVARYLGVHRGDRFERLVSMSSPSVGLQAYRERALPPGDPKRQETYACGDVNTSLLRTARGRTVVLQHDVVSPRPYSRINMVSGTKGTFTDYPPRIFFDGQKEEEWQELHQKEGRSPGGIEDRYEDPLWKRLAKPAEESGHGGMDYVMSWRLVQCLREGLAPDMDVYDAAAWSAPAALSEQSVGGGSVPVEFPDFTRGRWGDRRA